MARLAWFTLTLALPTSALAQAPVVESCALWTIPPDGSNVPEEAVDAVAEVSRARARLVMTADDARLRVQASPSLANCDRVECAQAMLPVLRVEAVVQLRVWRDAHGRPTTVTVGLADENGTHGGSAEVANGGVFAAARRASQQAWDRLAASRGVRLRITSEPSGADVELDGQLLGRTPFERLVQAGERRVRILMDGYETEERRLLLRPERPHDELFTLREAGARNAAPVAAFDPVPHVIGGASLSAVGLALIITAPLVSTTCQTAGPGGSCLAGVGYDEGLLAGLLGPGIALLAAGGVWLTWALLQPNETVQVSLGVDGLNVSGRF